METNRLELIKILEAVKPGLAVRQTHEQATHFIFTKSDVATFNDRLCISYPYKTDFRCSVKAADFYRWLKAIDGETMKLALEGKEVLALVGDDEAGFSCILDENHMVEKHIRRRNKDAKGEFETLPPEFLEAINLTLFSCSTDLSRSALTCVHIEGKDVMSSDGMRLSWYVMSAEMPRVLIRARDLAELVKFPVTQYRITSKWVHFRTDDGVMFSAKRVVGEYPDKRPHFDTTYKLPTITQISLPSEAIRHSLNATTIMVEEADMIDRYVEVKLEAGSILITSERRKGLAQGWARSRIEMPHYSSDPIQFRINPIFLYQILDKISTFTLKEERRALFKRENFTHIIALTPKAKE